MIRWFIFFGILFGCTTLRTTAQTPSFVTDSLDNYIKRGLAQWQVPGLALAIVHQQKVVVAKGYGVKDVTTKAPVDANTLFYIASNSKLFTGTALAHAAYRKKLQLDDKITRYFPDYSLYDTSASQLVSVRDMLTHRIGTKTFQGDFTFFNGNISRSEIMYRMRFMQPSAPFRQTFGYCNSCYLTAGEVLRKATNIPWEVYVYDSLLTPLEMRQSHTLSRGAERMKNIATPYTTAVNNQLTAVPYDDWDNLAPAASIISNANDLTHWLKMQLDSGRYNGKQILPWSVIAQTRDINTIISSRKNNTFPSTYRGYGLGLFVQDWNGYQVYWHSGGASGMVSYLAFIPALQVGFAILTNNDDQNFFTALWAQLLDAYTGMPYTDRNAPMLQAHLKEKEAQATANQKLQERQGNNKPPQPLEQYAGSYEHPLYGKVTVTVSEQKLQFKFHGHNNLTATAQYIGNNEWLPTFNNAVYGNAPMKFTLEKGIVTHLTVKVSDFVEYDSYTFTKVK